MRVDLGCGTNKQSGYIGIDRFKTPDTTIVCDIEEGIPLEDNSVEYLIASHSLEHVNDLMKTMKEIYRICKHKTLVCIVAPYYHTSLNIANPLHKIAFNEHTPRFFTANNFTTVSKEDYYFPHAENWALGQSDNAKLDIDFRCLKMKFFYFPAYRNLSNEAKLNARSNQINVVDQILYQLLVIKEEISDSELEYISQNANFEEPTYIKIRELKEQLEDKKIIYDSMINRLKEEISSKDDELNSKEKEFQEIFQNNMRNVGEKEKIREQCKTLEKKHDDLLIDNQIQKTESETLKMEFQELFENSRRNIKEKEKIQQHCESLEKRCDELFIDNQAQKRETEILKTKIGTENKKIMEQFSVIQSKESSIKSVLLENEILKSMKLIKMKNQFKYTFKKGSQDISNLMNPICKELVIKSVVESTKDLNRHIVRNSGFLKQDEIIYYLVRAGKNNWNGIEVILTNISLMNYDSVLGVEILDPNNVILRTIFINSEQIKNNEISIIKFAPIEDSKDKNYIIRFVGLANIENCGVSLFEWQRYGILGTKNEIQFLGKKIYLEN